MHRMRKCLQLTGTLVWSDSTAWGSPNLKNEAGGVIGSGGFQISKSVSSPGVDKPNITEPTKTGWRPYEVGVVICVGFE